MKNVRTVYSGIDLSETQPTHDDQAIRRIDRAPGRSRFIGHRRQSVSTKRL